MNPEVFLNNVDLVSEASNGIESLRAYIYQLAIEGKLVEQIPSEESAEILISKIKSEKEKLIKQGGLKKTKNESNVVVPLEILPKGWLLTCLAELGLVNPRNSLADGLEVSFIPMKLVPEGFSGEASFEVRKWKDIKGGFTHIASNDVVMAKITPCFQNRKSVVLKDLKNGFGAGTTELHVFRAIPNTTIPEYVLLFLKSANFINIGIPKMTGSAGQKRVPNDYFSFTPIPLPPREEQKRIVAKVDQLMALCDELETKQEKQTHIRRQLNDAALNALLSAASPEDFEEHSRRIIDNFDLLYDDLENLQSFRQAILKWAIEGDLTGGNIGWGTKTLGEVADLINGRAFKPSDWKTKGLPIIRIQNLNNLNAGFNYFDGEVRKRFVVNTSDILLAWSGTPGTSFGAHLWTREKGILNQHIFRVDRRDLSFEKRFLILAINSKLDELIASSRGGVGLRHVTKGDCEKIVLPLPPMETQISIVGKVDQLMALCDELEKKLNAKSAHLEKLTESLLRV